MPAHLRTSQPAHAAVSTRRRRDAWRVLAVLLSVIGLILTSSALNWVDRVSAATEPKKAVVVAGPVHSKTDKYRAYCKDIADAAQAQGMQVVRINHPWAPASRVKARAQNADLFVYCGHGNGWPSAYGPFQEDTKNGLGLDAEDEANRSPNTVKYKGANWLRDNIVFAPNAVVILSHLSYASGNASSGMPTPSREVAIKRVDNFANGFLSIGARVVWALGWQPGADIVNALHQEDATMDAVFMTRYREGANPRNGWIGSDPGHYDSERIPGATVHIDPDPAAGYLRGITGDLGFTTTAWRDAESLPADTVAPKVSNVRARQEGVTLSSASVPVFTPNGDGLSDRVPIDYKLSEGAYLEVKVKRQGSALRRSTTWALQGAGTVTWNGRKDNGDYATEGNYNIYLTPTDRAGNKGEPAVVTVKLLNSARNPRVTPDVFWARDGDDRAAFATFRAKLTRQAKVSWTIRNKNGTIVRKGIQGEVRQPGNVNFKWDGRNDQGAFVADGRYTARIWVQREAGSYGHEVSVRHTPFMASSSRWTYRRGETMKMTLYSTEYLAGKPVVTVNQPGIPKYVVPKSKVTRHSDKKFTVTIKTKNLGKKGTMTLRVVGTDKGGGTNKKFYSVKLQ